MSLFQNLNITANTSKQLGRKLEMVGDNINNAGTNGFKGSRAEFSEMLNTASMGADGGDQVGAGAIIDASKRDLSQGTLAHSNSATDLAIDGTGLFAVNTPFGQAYTRDGSFRFDKDGYLVTSDGHKVLGYNGEEGQESNTVSPLQLSNGSMNASATSNVSMTMNLDAREDIKVFDIQNPRETSSFERSVTVLDSKGEQQSLTMYFTKTAQGVWSYNAVGKGEDLDPAVEGDVLLGTGTASFDNKGVLVNDSGLSANVTFKENDEQAINFSLTDKGVATTQFGTDTSVSSSTRNGNEAGSVVGLGFDKGGSLTLRYDNGKSVQLGKIAVAKFTNEQGLRRVGQNLFVGNQTSGQVSLGKSGEQGRGDIRTNAIEQSNVDITNNFVDMMKTQKSFSANSEAMSAIDGLLKNVIALR